LKASIAGEEINCDSKPAVDMVRYLVIQFKISHKIFKILDKLLPIGRY
jgi:hypothetical protein